MRSAAAASPRGGCRCRCSVASPPAGRGGFWKTFEAREGSGEAPSFFNAVEAQELVNLVEAWLTRGGGSNDADGDDGLKVSDVGEANAVALVFVNTNMAAAGGLVFALLLSRLWFGKADLTMALNGALAGLVAITADPLSPSPFAAQA